MCREKRVCSATDKGRHGSLGPTGLLSMHDALRVEDFVPAEANIELDKICGPM